MGIQKSRKALKFTKFSLHCFKSSDILYKMSSNQAKMYNKYLFKNSDVFNLKNIEAEIPLFFNIKNINELK